MAKTRKSKLKHPTTMWMVQIYYMLNSETPIMTTTTPNIAETEATFILDVSTNITNKTMFTERMNTLVKHNTKMVWVIDRYYCWFPMLDS